MVGHWSTFWSDKAKKLFLKDKVYLWLFMSDEFTDKMNDER